MSLSKQQIMNNISAEIDKAIKLVVVPKPIYTLDTRYLDIDSLEDLTFVSPEITVLETTDTLSSNITRFLCRKVRVEKTFHFTVLVSTDRDIINDIAQFAFEGMKDLWLKYNQKQEWRRTSLYKRSRNISEDKLYAITDLYIDAHKCGLFTKAGKPIIDGDSVIAARLFSSKFEEVI